jgi:hypothetical protein
VDAAGAEEPGEAAAERDPDAGGGTAEVARRDSPSTARAAAEASRSERASGDVVT